MSVNKTKVIKVIDFNSIKSHINWINTNRVNKLNKRRFPAKLVIFDFSKCNFLKPYHIAPLACLIHEYRQNGYTIKLRNISNKISDYFDSFKFNQFCYDNQSTNAIDSVDPKILPLWQIEKSRISIYPASVQNYYEKNHFDGKSLFALSLSLAELMNNVFDHSDSKIPGYTFTQYNSTQNLIITCVCDFGNGIPKTINEYLQQQNQPKLDNISALIKSFELKFSSKSQPHNRGFGLDNIFANVKELRSKILIIRLLISLQVSNSFKRI